MSWNCRSDIVAPWKFFDVLKTSILTPEASLLAGKYLFLENQIFVGDLNS